MAKAVAVADEQGPPAKAGPSLVVQIAVLLVMTGVAVGLGFASAGFIKLPEPQPVAEDAAAHGADAAHGKEEKKDEKAEEDVPPVSLMPNVVMLPSITTNLAAPSDVWARMELALVFKEAPDPAIVEAVHQDLLAFMRTVKMHQIQGASGFQHLRADLDDRVRVRSDGKASGVLIRTLLFE